MNYKLKTVVDEFSLDKDDDRRKLGPHFDELLQFTALQSAPKEFEKVAKAILSGHFHVQNSSNESERVEVYPMCVEIYYHEEQANGVKDPIVYHRNRKKKSGDDNPQEFTPKGLLHNHVSGIDITFEHKMANNEIVRASALIREFMVKDKDGNIIKAIKNGKEFDTDDRSTYLYQALFGQFSIFDGFTVKWEDGEECELAEPTYRKNVVVYEPDGADYKKSEPYRQDLRKWKFRKR